MILAIYRIATLYINYIIILCKAQECSHVLAFRSKVSYSAFGLFLKYASINSLISPFITASTLPTSKFVL